MSVPGRVPNRHAPALVALALVCLGVGAVGASSFAIGVLFVVALAAGREGRRLADAHPLRDPRSRRDRALSGRTLPATVPVAAAAVALVAAGHDHVGFVVAALVPAVLAGASVYAADPTTVARSVVSSGRSATVPTVAVLAVVLVLLVVALTSG